MAPNSAVTTIDTQPSIHNQLQPFQLPTLSPENIMFTKHVNGVDPWEPLVKFGSNFYKMGLQARRGDTCHCCSTKLNPGQLTVSDGTTPVFCGWECLLKYADTVPHFYQVYDRGLY